MKSVLLIGLGRFGRHIAQKLHGLGHEVMAIDKKEDRVNAVMSFVTNAQIGDSTNEDFLKSLGVRSYDACIVAISDDFQSSLETSSLLAELGARKVISRACSDLQEKFLLRNGADEVVYPEKQLASWVATRCTSDSILDYIELGNDYSIFELTVPKSWDGKTIIELDIRKRYEINVLGIRQNGKLNMKVRPDSVLRSNESILILGEEKAIHKCFNIK